MSLLLLRDVAAEEELLACYVDAAAPLRERAAALRAMHGFVCRCERCGVQRVAAGARRRARVRVGSVTRRTRTRRRARPHSR